MKQLHLFSLLLGLVIGLMSPCVLPCLRGTLLADDKKEIISQEELDKNLDAILESQKELMKKLETITEQTQFLKASSGK